MAQNTDIDLTAGAWTLLTDSNVTAATIQNIGVGVVLLKGTVGATPPTVIAGSLRLGPMEAIAADMLLSQVFPGVAATRVYAYPMSAGGRVFVSHA